jgi:hypothetical protein
VSAARGRPYSDPYVAGALLGLVLLASFVVAGRGLGASGAFVTGAASVVEAIAPANVAASPVLAVHVGGGGPWHDWLVYEIAGVVAGGHLSARASGRIAPGVERGTGVTVRARIAWSRAAARAGSPSAAARSSPWAAGSSWSPRSPPPTWWRR